METRIFRLPHRLRAADDSRPENRQVRGQGRNGSQRISRAKAESDGTGDAHGENLAAHAELRRGEGPLPRRDFRWRRYIFNGTDWARSTPLTASVGMEKNRFTISRAAFSTTGKTPSTLNLSDVSIDDFNAPVVTAKYTGAISLDEIDRVFKLVDFQHTGTVGVTRNRAICIAARLSRKRDVQRKRHRLWQCE